MLRRMSYGINEWDIVVNMYYRIFNKHVDEVPQLRSNAFYKCPSCMTRKLGIKQPVGNNRRKNTKQQHVETVSNLSSSYRSSNTLYLDFLTIIQRLSSHTNKTHSIKI